MYLQFTTYTSVRSVGFWTSRRDCSSWTFINTTDESNFRPFKQRPPVNVHGSCYINIFSSFADASWLVVRLASRKAE